MLGGEQEPEKGQKERKEDLRQVRNAKGGKYRSGKWMDLATTSHPHLKGLCEADPPTSLSDFCPSLGTPSPLGLSGTYEWS